MTVHIALTIHGSETETLEALQNRGLKAAVVEPSLRTRDNPASQRTETQCTVTGDTVEQSVENWFQESWTAQHSGTDRPGALLNYTYRP